MFHVHLKGAHFASLGWKVLYISVKPIWSRAICNAAISLVMLCLEYLSIFDSEVLKSPSISVLLSISFLKSSKIFLMYLFAPMLGAYMFIMFMSSWWILPLSIMKCPSGSLLKSLLSHTYIATMTFFPLHLLGIFVSSHLLSACVGLLFWGRSRVGSIWGGHDFLSIQLPYVFWLEH